MTADAVCSAAPILECRGSVWEFLNRSGENVHTEICVNIFRRKNESGKVGDDCERGAAGTNGLHVIYSRA